VYALKIKREINRNLRDQISKLSPGQQSALMRTLKGMKAKDIAAQDGCCIGKVLKDIHRAKEMLRRKKNLIFEKEGFNETCSIIFRGVFADGILFC
jgi:DNA-directed RNA polymerase specialized sigma24 family protein